MIRGFLTLSLPIFLVLTLMFQTNSMAITAEDRLIEVERQLQAIAEQISNYEGQLSDLENAILENDKDLQQVNQELAEVQSRLSAAERELEKALENYDGTLNWLKFCRLLFKIKQILEKLIMKYHMYLTNCLKLKKTW